VTPFGVPDAGLIEGAVNAFRARRRRRSLIGLSFIGGASLKVGDTSPRDPQDLTLPISLPRVDLTNDYCLISCLSWLARERL
jgi:hypothetical protein